MKTKAILASIIVFTALLVGCTQAPATDTTDSSKTTTEVVTTASIVDSTTAFENAISKNGTWIIAITKDLKVDAPLILDGKFLNGKKDASGNDITQRKIALYTQDANQKVTARFVLTAPSLTIDSPNASIEHGTFVGDLYVAAENFQLKDAKIQGNLYFTTPEAQASFLMDGTSSVTGV